MIFKDYAQRDQIIILITFLFFPLSPIISLFLLLYYFSLESLLVNPLNYKVKLIVGLSIIIYSLVKIFINQGLLGEVLRFKTALLLEYGIANGILKIILQEFNLDFLIKLLESGIFIIPGVFILVHGIIIFYLKAKNIYRVDSNLELNSPFFLKDEVELGMSSSNTQVTISIQELNQHCLVMGTTGSGKTTTLLNFVKSCCEKELPLVYIDGKGSLKLAGQIKKICEKYGRNFKVFSLDPHDNTPNLATYNPFASGNYTEWKNKILTMLGSADSKGQEHYEIQEHSYLSLVCEILYKSGIYVDLEVILAYLKDNVTLQKLANQIELNLAHRLLQEIRQNESKFKLNAAPMSDAIRILEMFYYSNYGRLFSTRNKESHRLINLKESIEQGEIILFLLDGATYQKDTDLIGKLIINDINAVWSGFGRQGRRVPGFAIFDEFASYVSANMANILAMQRDNGLHAVIGTQSINAISKKSSLVSRVAVELIANCNTYIIHKLNDPVDLKLVSDIIGTRKSNIVAHSISSSGDVRKNITSSYEHVLSQEQISSLDPGYGFICRTLVNGYRRLEKVKFNFIGA